MTIEQIDLDGFFLQRFKNGDEHAFEEIFKVNYNRITGFCQQFVYDNDKAQEITQEVFLNLWLNREKIECINGIRAFLYTFAKSNCLNHIRHERIIHNYANKYLHEYEQNVNCEILETFDFRSLQYTELENLVQKAINDLSVKCRQVFILRRIEGKSNKEIADELNISVKAVEANMTRALKAISISLVDYIPVTLLNIVFNHIS